MVGGAAGEADQESLKDNELREGIVVADVAASFQQAVVDVLVEKTSHATQAYQVNEILLSGGVSANLPCQFAIRHWPCVRIMAR